MKKIVYIVCTFIVIALLVSCAVNLKSATSPSFHETNTDKVAIIVTYHQILPHRMVEDQFMRELVRKGYQVPARSDIDTILGELQLQYSDITDEDASRIGKMLNVHAILVVSITRHEKWVGTTLGARLVNIEKSDVLWIGSIDAGVTPVDSSVIQAMSQRLAEEIPARSQ